MAGAGGHWPTIGEAPDNAVVRQESPLSCVCACGEMLARMQGVSDLSQADLLARIGAPAGARDLSLELSAADGSGHWIGGALNLPGASVTELVETLNGTGPWGAVLRSTGTMSHMVVVDGVDEVGHLVIRDPWESTSYTMRREDFIDHWTTEAVFRP